MRKLQFQKGEYYHVYNRGTDKRNIYLDSSDYYRFLISMIEFNTPYCVGSLFNLYKDQKLDSLRKSAQKLNKKEYNKKEKLVDIVCYSLLPNHFHLILKELRVGGISKFMLKLGCGYTNFVNYKLGRNGVLFQGPFKAVHIDSDEYLLYLSGYIHGNSQIHKINSAFKWKWSSLKDFFDKKKSLSGSNFILNQFADIEEYKNFLNKVIKDSANKKNSIKKYLLEL